MNIKHIAQLKGTELILALCNHFNCLAPNAEWENILKAVFSKALSAKTDKDQLIVFFSGNRKLIASAPAKKDSYADWPVSFQKITSIHERISFPGDARGLHLGESDNFEPEQSEGEALNYHEKGYKLLSPLTDYSDWWVYHPEIKTELGNTVLYRFDHGECDFGERFAYSVGELFLMRLAAELDIEVVLPTSPAIVNNSDTEFDAWWNDLDDNWQELIRWELEIEEGETPSKNKVKSIDYLSVSDDETTSLLPLIRLEGLKKLTVRGKNIKDISSIGECSKLESLSISDNDVAEISVLSKLTNLKKFTTNKTQFRDLGQLAGLSKLEDLTLFNTPIDSLDELSNLNPLRSLDVSNTPIQSIAPLMNLEKLRYLQVTKTSIPLIEIILLKNKNPNCTIKFTTEGRTDELIEELKRVEDINQIAKGYCFVFQVIVEQLRYDDAYNKGLDLISFFLSKFKENLHEIEPGEKIELLKTSILFLMNADEDMLELSKDIFSNLLPKEIEDSSLSFALAKYCCRVKNIAETIDYAIKCLQLGKEAASFFTDEAFAEYHSDTKFKEAIEGFELPDPEKNPIRWWDALPKIWKHILKHQVDDFEEAIEENILKILQLRKFISYSENLESLYPLKYLSKLKEIRIRNGSYTSLKPLGNLTELEELELENNNKITGLEPLSNLTKLKSIRIFETMGTHPIKSLEGFQNLVNLESFFVLGSKIEDLSPLQNLSKLRTISLNNAEVKDPTPISGLANLETVYLGNGALETIECFIKIPKLQMLFIGSNNIPKEEIEAFKKERPDVQLQ